MRFGEVFNMDYVTGSVDRGFLGTITSWIGTGALYVISIIGFGIVMAALAKNAFAGLYYITPNFWDKVDDAKKIAYGGGKEKKGFSGLKSHSQEVGSLGYFVLSLFPNIKAFVDDNAKNCSPASYFLKAIPMAGVQVFIGVLIFYGYAAKIAEYVSDIGTRVIDLVIANTDPLALVDMVSDSYVIYAYQTDGSDVPEDELVNAITKKAVAAYVAVLSDMPSGSRLSVSTQIEDWVMQREMECTDFNDRPDLYKYTYDVRVVTGRPDVSKNGAENTKGGKNYIWATPLNTWENGSLLDDGTKYLQVRVNFTRVAENIKADKISNTVWYAGYYSSGTDYVIEIPGSCIYMGNNSENRGIRLTSVSEPYKAVGQTVTIPQEKFTITADGQIVLNGVAGVTYKCDVTGKSYSITKIVLVNTNKNTFEATKGSKKINWNLNDNPEAVGETDDESNE